MNTPTATPTQAPVAAAPAAPAPTGLAAVSPGMIALGVLFGVCAWKFLEARKQEREQETIALQLGLEAERRLAEEGESR